MSNKRGVIKFTIKMFLLFIIVQALTINLPSLLTRSVIGYKYGTEFIAELFWAFFILIIMLLSKNEYVFHEKGKKFFDSIKLGVPFLVISIISLLSNLDKFTNLNINNFINLILLCTTIGIAEEFLCRGWILNEFLEKFGKNRKEVMFSILFSSLLFGGMHITNILAGQNVFDTILQILQATSLGFLLGSIYFRTKNIWSVVFLHGFYDFTLMLSDVNSLKNCVSSTPSGRGLIYTIFVSFILVTIYILTSLFLLRKAKVNEVLNNNYIPNDSEKEQDRKYKKNIKAHLIIACILMFLPIDVDTGKITCFNYDEYSIDSYETHYMNYDNYYVNYIFTDDNLFTNYYKFILYKKDNKLYFKNINTNYEKELNYKNIIDYYIIENEEYYSVLIYTIDDDNNTKMYYSSFLNNANISNSDELINTFINSFNCYDLPTTQQIGYLTTSNSSYKYPLILDYYYNKFIIDSNGILYKLK